MAIRIPALLDAILEATAEEAGAKARIAALRATLETEARRRFTEEGAAPAWNAPGAGKVRYDPPGDWTPTVGDAAAFGSWAAQHYPTEVTAVVRLPVEHLDEVLTAVGFALSETERADVTVATEVRPAWLSTYLTGLVVDVEEAGVGEDLETVTTVVDPETGEVPEGLTASKSTGKLVVSLDRDRRTLALEDAREQVAMRLKAAGVAADPHLDERRRELEGMPVEVLAAYAGRLGLSKSGTKAEHAERISRLEAETGRREELTTATALRDETPPEALAEEEARALEVENAGSREDLRKLAKAKGLNSSGTKGETARRLAAAGVTADDVRRSTLTPIDTQEHTP